MKRLYRFVLLAAGLLLASQAVADSNMIYEKDVSGKLDVTYKHVFNGLENNGYFVIFEPNIGHNLANFKQRWGKEYNTNKLESIRSMVISNAWYTNKVANADPQMLALFPLHITLVYKNGVTRILFVRPSLVATGSPAEKVVLELEQDVIRTIESSVQ
ncbi:MAG: DUF302 domain-containing protein [Gammaproteobacteria bacterium]